MTVENNKWLLIMILVSLMVFGILHFSLRFYLSEVDKSEEFLYDNYETNVSSD